MIAQFTTKTTNSEKAIYFLPLMSCSALISSSVICSSNVKILCFPILRGKKCMLQEMGGEGVGAGILPASSLPTALFNNKKCEVEPYFCCPSFHCSRVGSCFTIPANRDHIITTLVKIIPQVCNSLIFFLF